MTEESNPPYPHLIESDDLGRAAEEIMINMRASLEKQVSRICPPWLADCREDFIQASLLRVMQVINKSEEKRTFKGSYLWKVAYSTMVNEIRRIRRARAVPFDEEQGEAPSSDCPNPEHRASAKQIGEEIYECLGRMIERRRVATTLYLQGHSTAEISALLNWPEKKTENLVYRGMQQLRICLNKKGLKP